MGRSSSQPVHRASASAHAPSRARWLSQRSPIDRTDLARGALTAAPQVVQPIPARAACMPLAPSSGICRHSEQHQRQRHAAPLHSTSRKTRQGEPWPLMGPPTGWPTPIAPARPRPSAVRAGPQGVRRRRPIEAPVHQSLDIAQRNRWGAEGQHGHRTAFRPHQPAQIRLGQQHKPAITNDAAAGGSLGQRLPQGLFLRTPRLPLPLWRRGHLRQASSRGGPVIGCDGFATG